MYNLCSKLTLLFKKFFPYYSDKIDINLLTSKEQLLQQIDYINKKIFHLDSAFQFSLFVTLVVAFFDSLNDKNISLTNFILMYSTPVLFVLFFILLMLLILRYNIYNYINYRNQLIKKLSEFTK